MTSYQHKLGALCKAEAVWALENVEGIMEVALGRLVPGPPE